MLRQPLVEMSLVYIKHSRSAKSGAPSEAPTRVSRRYFAVENRIQCRVSLLQAAEIVGSRVAQVYSGLNGFTGEGEMGAGGSSSSCQQ